MKKMKKSKKKKLKYRKRKYRNSHITNNNLISICIQNKVLLSKGNAEDGEWCGGGDEIGNIENV